MDRVKRIVVIFVTNTTVTVLVTGKFTIKFTVKNIVILSKIKSRMFEERKGVGGTKRLAGNGGFGNMAADLSV